MTRVYDSSSPNIFRLFSMQIIRRHTAMHLRITSLFIFKRNSLRGARSSIDIFNSLRSRASKIPCQGKFSFPNCGRDVKMLVDPLRKQGNRYSRKRTLSPCIYVFSHGVRARNKASENRRALIRLKCTPALCAAHSTPSRFSNIAISLGEKESLFELRSISDRLESNRAFS